MTLTKPESRVSYLSVRNEAGGSNGRGTGGVEVFVLQGKYSGSGWQSEDQVVQWHSEGHHQVHEGILQWGDLLVGIWHKDKGCVRV